jgi:hypothetical protein
VKHNVEKPLSLIIIIFLDLLSRGEDVALAQIDFAEDGTSSHWKNMNTTTPSWNQSR